MIYLMGLLAVTIERHSNGKPETGSQDGKPGGGDGEWVGVHQARLRGRECGGVIHYGSGCGSVEMRGHGRLVNEVGRVGEEEEYTCYSSVFGVQKSATMGPSPFHNIPMDLRFDGSFYTSAIVAGVFHLPLHLTRVLSIAPVPLPTSCSHINAYVRHTLCHVIFIHV